MTDLLDQSEKSYRTSLEIYDGLDYPIETATLFNNLANTLREKALQSKRDESLELLSEATTFYRDAIQIFQLEEQKQQEIIVKNNLGIALRERAIRLNSLIETLETLDIAIETFEECLQEISRDRNLLSWVSVKMNLASVLQDKASRMTSSAIAIRLLERSVVIFKEALNTVDEEGTNREWAFLQNNLGNALWDLGRRMPGEPSIDLLNEAIAAFDAALLTFTRTKFSRKWAATKHNQANALRDLALRNGRGEKRSLLLRSITAYLQALEVFNDAHFPDQYATVHLNLGQAYFAMEKWTEAAGSFENVLKFKPSSWTAYAGATYILHEKLFDFHRAFAIANKYSKHHEPRVDVLSNLAEMHFTTGRHEDCGARLEALESSPELPIDIIIQLSVVRILNLIAIDLRDHYCPVESVDRRPN